MSATPTTPPAWLTDGVGRIRAGLSFPAVTATGERSSGRHATLLSPAGFREARAIVTTGPLSIIRARSVV